MKTEPKFKVGDRVTSSEFEGEGVVTAISDLHSRAWVRYGKNQDCKCGLSIEALTLCPPESKPRRWVFESAGEPRKILEGEYFNCEGTVKQWRSPNSPYNKYEPLRLVESPEENKPIPDTCTVKILDKHIPNAGFAEGEGLMIVNKKAYRIKLEASK